MRKAYLCPHSRLVKVYEVLEVVFTVGGCVPPILSVCRVYSAPDTGLWSHERVSELVSQLTWPVKLVDGHRAEMIQRKVENNSLGLNQHHMKGPKFIAVHPLTCSQHHGRARLAPAAPVHSHYIDGIGLATVEVGEIA